MTHIPIRNVHDLLSDLERQNSGVVPNDLQARTMIMAAFANDLAAHFGDRDQTIILQSIARLAFQSWTLNGQSVEQLVTAIGMLMHPRSPQVSVRVEIVPYTDEQSELFHMKPEGSA